MPFELMKLPYDQAALEPSIDALTVQIHHGKHHQTYVNNLNNALAGKPELAGKSLEDLLTNLAAVPEDIRTAVRNNAGGVWNHNFYWNGMAAKGQGGGGEPSGKLADAIKSAFGSFADFKTKFADAAVKRFGSGYGWLVRKDGKLVIASTANQDSPLNGEALAGISGKPLLVVDVWEHAYYLKYQNRRADYLAAWWDVVNWSKVAELFGS